MMKIFGATSTTDEVLDGINLRGKRVFITGVSAGLGVETARALVAHGADVIGTVRDLDKAHVNTKVVRDAAAQSGGSVEIIHMDLADLASVRKVSDAMAAANQPFDLVVANAGVMATPFEHTKDGFESQFGTNVLGHFVLANRLAPLMRDGARLILLSSNGHRFADVDLDDPNFAHTPYDPWLAYGRSKTGDALLAVAFDARHRHRGVRAASIHPGVILTELVRNMDPADFQAAFTSMNEQHLALGFPPFEVKTVAQGAATTLWAGITADAETIGGKYCEDCHVGEILADDAAVSAFSAGVRPYAIDPVRADALWARAEELVGERF
ncbi:SDR family NAD(P)-dependent oxidoreductase [Pseudoduganella sp. FT25W]|uniref:Probable oxidoreductase n=2 Tax=Duganella alba TaxID=2666081 RepID=A0A6L5QNN6_9BURK|nr:SDR family NAD(P)-dependent oxidoreductase [Duganella alba]MRX19640.1 SDR family NAD(P)-dependent oxidoreductase [Duganella alba]